MKKLNLILLYPLLLVIVLTSCSSQQNIANLSFVDVSLNYSSVDFEIVDLKPITMSAESLFGVSENEFNSALLDRSKFNSGNGTSFGLATLIAGGIPIFITGLSSANLDQVAPPIPFFYGFISTLLWASYNDLIWSNSIRNKAIQRCNYELQLRNPKFDSYINPKYNIEYRNGFAFTKCTVTLNAQGVVLKNKQPYNLNTREELEIVNEDRDVSPIYERSAGDLNYLADLLRKIAPEASDVPGLSQKELKKFKRIIKRYESNYDYVKDFQDYQSANLLLSEEQFEAYWSEYIKVK